MRAAAWESTTRTQQSDGFAEQAAEYAAALLRPVARTERSIFCLSRAAPSSGRRGLC